MSKSPAASRSQDENSRILWLVSLATLIVAGFFVSGGHINVDEGLYHLMLRDFAATGGYALWNGYDEYPSAELALANTPIHQGQLVGSPPQLFAILAAPLYALLGYKALFLINASALVGALWLTVLLARRLFPGRPIGVAAGVIFALSTYAWDYAIAAMPHALSALCVLAAVYFMVRALDGLEHRNSLLCALAADLIAGFSAGIRLDAIFVLPALVVPFLFVIPWRPFHLLATLLGVLPGLAVTAALNLERFGHFNPFSYGPGNSGVLSLTPYLTVAGAGALALAGLWLVTRPRVQPVVRAHIRPLALGLAGLLLLALFVPPLAALGGRLFGGMFQLVVDLRIRDLGLEEPGLTRGPGGGMIYLGGLKKSLLQSCPYLVALAIPAWAMFSRPQHRPAIALLFLVPLTYVGVYGFFAWHGGQGLNLRYFLPILPFTSILTAYAVSELTKDLGFNLDRWSAVVGLVLLAAYALAVFPRPLDLSEQEAVYLSFPLLLSAVLLVLVLLHIAGVTSKLRALQGLTVLLLLAAMFWSRIVTFAYDLPKSYLTREVRVEFARAILPELEQDSLLFVTQADLFFDLFEHPRLRIATPAHDDFQDFEPLAHYHISAGRPVYVWLDPWLRSELEQRRIWPRIRSRSLLRNKHGELIEILSFQDP